MTSAGTLKGKTLFITGASRGIGKAIALRAARDGANVAIAAKTTEPHPKLDGTIHTAAAEIEAAGGKALAIQCDIRDEAQVAAAIQQTVEAFGGLDVLVNNASAISLTGTLETPPKRWDLMMGVNGRGTFVCSQAAIPHLLKAENPHILTLSPPLNLNPRWFKHHTAYTIAKYAMSLCTLGMAAEFKGRVAVNSLWPRTIIGTAAVAMLKGAAEFDNCRKPEILADAAHAILTRDARTCTGNFFIDDEVLREAGVTDLDVYAVTPGVELAPDIFLD
ncbi:NAD(P)-dependent oxidoreductase [Azospirillum sp. TSO22-1]|uniref:SDR family oxidoreductase n=1 Tax=Azospirillum sp. TSO22-1 TaxID=716789 RepID=UPI000D605E2B|nr:NAD(P)-dependent oxidoreductase [Azospirillum sp. TSO22-1]PWC38511.1 short-chain dehydrogenase [Azospirillum sp. TSO22-1]